MLSIGYTADELYTYLVNFEYVSVEALDIDAFIINYGIETGDKIKKYMEKMLNDKINDIYNTTYSGSDITFSDLYNLTNKRLWIPVTCLNTEKCEYLCVKNTPNISVSDALRMTISIPFIFSAVKVQSIHHVTQENIEKIYVDGGLMQNFPLNIFSSCPNKVLGIQVKNARNNEKRTLQYQTINNWESYLVQLWSCIYSKLNKIKRDYPHVITIRTRIKIINFELSMKQKQKLYNRGYTVAVNRYKKEEGESAPPLGTPTPNTTTQNTTISDITRDIIKKEAEIIDNTY